MPRERARGLGAVGAGFCVEAGVGDAEPLNGVAGDEVFRDDIFGVFRLNAAVPDGIGVDDDCGAVLALVEAARFVDADAAGETGFARELRKSRVERALAIVGARRTRRIRRTDVMADEDVAFEWRHGIRIAE